MQEATQALQSAMQPLLKLTQANMDLLTQFTTSPEVLAQSNAFAQLTQGILKNYTDFVTELSQSGMAALAEGQAEMVRRTQQAGATVIDATTERSKRTR